MKGESRNQAVIAGTVLFLILSTPLLAQSIARHQVSQTPYDPYMGAFRTVAARGLGHGLNMEAVKQLTEKANDIRYDHIEDFRARSPEEVEASGRGDCKDKALWLYSKLTAMGAQDIQLVIGKKDSRAQEFHAWLYLSLNGHTYLLDPTFSASVSEASDFGAEEYIPVYAYSANGSYVYDTAAAGMTSDPRYEMPIPSIAGN